MTSIYGTADAVRMKKRDGGSPPEMPDATARELMEASAEDWRRTGLRRFPADQCEFYGWEIPMGFVVYYVQRHSDSLVKIGTSGHFRQRMLQLHKRFGDISVLRLEWGTYHEERRAHVRFEAHRVEGEWFRPADELMSYIAS